MTVVFDLDYTLYDTVALREDILEELVAFGYGREQAEETFTAARRATPSGTGFYVPELHAALLTSLRTDLASEKRITDLIISRAEGGARFLYPGVLDMLMHLRQRGHRLTLLTLGDDRWQRAKADGAGLSSMFDRIVTTTDDKETVLFSLKGVDAQTVVVNDNVPETVRMRTSVPDMYYIIKRGPKGIPDECDFPIAGTAADVERIILA